MGIRKRVVVLGVVTAAVVAGSGLGAASAFGSATGGAGTGAASTNGASTSGASAGRASAGGAAGHAAKAAKHVVTFKTEHVRGVKNPVLVTSKGLVVYTFTGDKRGKAGTCAGQCAVIWPLVRGTGAAAHGASIAGKFGVVKGQVTFNGLPLYLFIGEKPGKNHADSQFKVVVPQLKKGHNTSPQPAPSATGGSW